MVTTRGTTENSGTRVLVLMPTGRDASLVCSELEKVGFSCREVTDETDLLKQQAIGAGAILIADEALREETLETLVATLDRQPIWSDLPVIIFATGGQRADKLLEMIGARFNATIVERPIRIALLISAVRSALRARERQYQTRDLLHQLEESDRQKDLFLATLSHELRTPLNSMLGWIQMLRGKLNGINEIDPHYALEVIERNARSQSELISDILFVSRIITGKLKLNFETIDLISVLKAAIDVVRPSVEAKEIRLETHFKSAGQIKGDPDKLQQVFWNVLSNAVKFTPSAGKIEIAVRRRGAQFEIEISDDGQGIEPEFLPFIFERFRQADNSIWSNCTAARFGFTAEV
jgi:signal transduction histidine kinase